MNEYMNVYFGYKKSCVISKGQRTQDLNGLEVLKKL